MWPYIVYIDYKITRKSSVQGLGNFIIKGFTNLLQVSVSFREIAATLILIFINVEARSRIIE